MRRRQHDRGFKDDLIAQSLAPGASVAAIAMKGGVNANLLFKWRRERVMAKIESTPRSSHRNSPTSTVLSDLMGQTSTRCLRNSKATRHFWPSQSRVAVC